MQKFSYSNKTLKSMWLLKVNSFIFLGRKPSKAKLLQARGLHPFQCYGSHQRTFTLLLWTENNGSKLPSKCYTSLKMFRHFSSDRITKKTFKALRGTTTKLKKSQLKHPKPSFRYLSFNNDQPNTPKDTSSTNMSPYNRACFTWQRCLRKLRAQNCRITELRAILSKRLPYNMT